jgi:hypothetical protein
MSDLYDTLRAAVGPGEEYLHLVVFKPREGITDEQIEEIVRRFNALVACKGQEEGILHAAFGKNLDTRKGYTLIELVVFCDVEAFIAWHAHPAHTAFSTWVSGLMAESIGWVTADCLLSDLLPQHIAKFFRSLHQKEVNGDVTVV